MDSSQTWIYLGFIVFPLKYWYWEKGTSVVWGEASFFSIMKSSDNSPCVFIGMGIIRLDWITFYWTNSQYLAFEDALEMRKGCIDSKCKYVSVFSH